MNEIKFFCLDTKVVPHQWPLLSVERIDPTAVHLEVVFQIASSLGWCVYEYNARSGGAGLNFFTVA